jgi:NAD(P)-dependent dehydrogenase (short-subunit alcohol dehydrogenase family)
VTSHDDLQRAVDYISEREGHINLLVNNAGISTPNLEPHAQRPTPRWEVSRVREYWFNKSFEDYAKVFETNTTASLMTTFAFLELLDNGNKHSQSQAKACNGHGSSGKADFVRSQVVGLGSVGAFGRDNSAFIYGASKAGTVQMMKNLGTYLIPWRIRVNAIAPGCKCLLPFLLIGNRVA